MGHILWTFESDEGGPSNAVVLFTITALTHNYHLWQKSNVWIEKCQWLAGWWPQVYGKRIVNPIPSSTCSFYMYIYTKALADSILSSVHRSAIYAGETWFAGENILSV